MEAFIGSIILFAGNFAPRGWEMCDGRLLSIMENTALFSILGTTYGGDGITTFALPDLRGRVPVHAGNRRTHPARGAERQPRRRPRGDRHATHRRAADRPLHLRQGHRVHGAKRRGHQRRKPARLDHAALSGLELHHLPRGHLPLSLVRG